MRTARTSWRESVRGRSASWLLALALLLPAAVAGQPADEEPLRLGVVTFYNARLMFVKYQPLVDYLSTETGRRWTLSVSTSYDATVEDLCAGRVALAYLGPLSYLRAHARCGAEPLLRLQADGRAVFHSDILVRTDSPFERLEDLTGQRVGFGDPLSTSSHLVPRAMLREAGLEAGRDIRVPVLRAARAGGPGRLDGRGRGLRCPRRHRRAVSSPGAASSRALWAGSGLPAGGLAEHSPGAEGEPVLGSAAGFRRPPGPLGPEDRKDLDLSGGFVPAVDADYDPVRELAEQVFGPGFTIRPEEELRCR